MKTESNKEIAEQIVRRGLGFQSDEPLDSHDLALIDAIEAALRNVSNRVCNECASDLSDGSGYCRTCDTFTMPSDFHLRWVRRTEMEAALDARDERAAKIADQWANSHSCDAHDDNPCCHVRTGATIRDLILGVKP